MKIKNVMAMTAALLLAANAALGQTIQLSGTVTAMTDSQITLKSGTGSWTIQRNPTTKVTSGTLSVGNVVTLQCVSPDAQKKEEPQSQPTPPSGR
ncbi:MAG TPA: hypothetical protein VEH26_04895 [Chthoniobacterales bacterium]|nr:hypothetical protein [Chthoniobacterales bacterium]